MKKRHRVTIEQVMKYSAALIVALMVIIPVTWAIITSFKWNKDIIIGGTLYSEFTLHNYWVVFFDPESSVLAFLFNSIVVVSVTLLITTLTATFTGYGLLRFGFTKVIKGGMLGILLFSRAYPVITAAVPFFTIARMLGIFDTYAILILVYTARNLPLAILMAMTFFEDVPKEVEESALIDGCSLFGSFRRIALPLAAPGIIATAVLVFIFSWNDYTFALFLTQERAGTLQLAVSWFNTEHAVRWGEMNAASLISALPVIIFTLLIQKNLIKGLTLGAVKG